ncbi:DUF7419 family protein [Mycolicibacterium fortuitum]
MNLADIQRTQAQFIATSSTCPACYRPRTECSEHGGQRR